MTPEQQKHVTSLQAQNQRLLEDKQNLLAEILNLQEIVKSLTRDKQYEQTKYSEQWSNK